MCENLEAIKGRKKKAYISSPMGHEKNNKKKISRNKTKQN